MLSRATGPRFAGLVVFGVALWSQHAGMVGVFFDDGVYVSLARALASGRGYVNGHLPGVVPGVHYPPLYPWALSLLWRLWPAFPDNVALFELFDAACLGIAAWIIARHARRLPLHPDLRVPLVTAGLVAFPVLAIVGVHFSEPLFLALAAGAIGLADRADRSWRVALAAGGLAGLAILTRSIGIAVAGGLVAAYALRGRWRQAAWAAFGAAVLATPWVVWVSRNSGNVPEVLRANYGTYAMELSQAGLGSLVGLHMWQVVRPLADMLIPALPLAVWVPLTVALGALVVWGLIRMWRDVPALVAVLGLYLALVAVWPYAPHRFLWIVLPWLLLAMAMGCRAAWRRFDWRPPRLVLAGFMLLLVVTGGAREVSSLRERRFASSAELISVPFRLLTAVVAAETPPDAVIASADEGLMSLYTNHRTLPAQLFRWEGREAVELDAVATRAALCALGANAIAVTGPDDGAARIAEGLPRQFQVRDGPGLYQLPCDH